MGYRFHRRNKSSILHATQIDTHDHRLVHEMDRGNPHKESYQHNHHPIPGDKHLVEVHMSHQYRNIQCGHVQV
jgi:hypothetical protein